MTLSIKLSAVDFLMMGKISRGMIELHAPSVADGYAPRCTSVPKSQPVQAMLYSLPSKLGALI